MVAAGPIFPWYPSQFRRDSIDISEAILEADLLLLHLKMVRRVFAVTHDHRTLALVMDAERISELEARHTRMRRLGPAFDAFFAVAYPAVTFTDASQSLEPLVRSLGPNRHGHLITLDGAPLAAIVSVRRWEFIRRRARCYLRKMNRIQAKFVDRTGWSLEKLEQEAIEACRRVRARSGETP